MKHDYEQNIKCPYCNWEDKDSWEFTDDSGTTTCGRCEEEFNVERNIEITYSTSRIDCEEKDTQHDYKFEEIYLRKSEFKNGSFFDLPEKEWSYKKIEMCSKCGDTNYTETTKEDYEEYLNQLK